MTPFYNRAYNLAFILMYVQSCFSYLRGEVTWTEICFENEVVCENIFILFTYME